MIGYVGGVLNTLLCLISLNVCLGLLPFTIFQCGVSLTLFNICKLTAFSFKYCLLMMEATLGPS